MANLKKRFLSVLLTLVTVFTMFPAISASAAESYNGGWAMMSENRTVYNDYNSSTDSLSNSKGTVYAHEGITVLNSMGNNVYYIQYQISSSPYYKQGYVRGGVNTAALGYTCVAKANTSLTTYYGPNTSTYDVAGSISSNELVSVIAANSPWAYIEYDTASGRKRAYVQMTGLTIYNQPSWMPNLYIYNGVQDNVTLTEPISVLAGPSQKYYKVGSVGTSDNPLYYYYEQTAADSYPGSYCYVEYTNIATGKLKSGFILVYH